MTADSLRTLSLRTFKATVYCAIAGIVSLIAVPSPGFRAAADLGVRIIATTGFALLGIAAITNLVSLVSGGIAWVMGSKRCPWIFASALVILVPVAYWVAFLMKL